MFSDKSKWNHKFASREFKPGKPEHFFVRHLNWFNPGSVLDLACGDGRNALFLASQNFEVTGIDISDVGLQRLQEFSENQNLSIATLEIDLDDVEFLKKELKLFDNIIISHFKPTPDLWEFIPTLLKEKGKLFCCTFNIKQHLEKGFSKRFCLETSELLEVHPDLKWLKYLQFKDNENHLDGYIFEKISKTSSDD